MDKLDAFIKELTDLTIKYRVEIGSCGCCDSPFLLGLDNEQQFDILAGNLKFDRDILEYGIELPAMPSVYKYGDIMYNADGSECERFESDLSEEEIATNLNNIEVVDSYKIFDKSNMYHVVCAVAGEVFCERTDQNGELYIKIFNETKAGIAAYYRLGLDKGLTFIRSTYPENEMAALTELLNIQLFFIMDWSEN